MSVLDDLQSINKLDKSNVYGSFVALADQIKDAWTSVNKLELPKECALAKNVVLAGMGGSALGGRVVKSLAGDRLRAPFEVVNDYHLPAYVGKDSLVILSSYSGTTEEVLSCGNQALSKQAGIFVIATGAKLQAFAQENSLPGYIIDPRFNPSNQPRMAVGYAIVAVLALLARCEFIYLRQDEMKNVESTVRGFIQEFIIEVGEKDNLAKKIAARLRNKMAILVASEHLVGAAHVFKNQLNENSKTFSALFELPELNHNLMEGLRNPAEAKRFWHFLFFESDSYFESVSKRYKITEDVVNRNEVGFSVYKLRSPDKLEQIFELITLGSFINFYLAMLYGIDPAPIKWVDYFKQELSV